MNNKCLFIPREINQNYLLFWKRDEMVFLMLPTLFLFLIGGVCGIALTLIGIIIVSQLLKELSIDKPNGYMYHWVKYNFPKQFVNKLFSKNSSFDIKESLLFKGESFPPFHLRYIAG